MAKYIIWHDNDFDLAIWVYNNSILKDHDVTLRCIPKTNSANQIINYFTEDYTKNILKYIKYETPDIIVQKISQEENNPVLCVTEFMTHTPQWQHPAQRFARLYTSSILKTPCAVVLPHYKIKWERGNREKYKKTSYTCSPSVYYLFKQATNLNKTPTLIYNWPDYDGYLKYDKKHQTAPEISEDIKEWFKFLNECILTEGNPNNSVYQNTYEKMSKRAEKTEVGDFDTLEGFFKTSTIIEKYNLDTSFLSSRFKNNQYTLVFKPTGLKCQSSKFRTDPYAGMLCAFDLMFCRNEEFERNTNLLLIADNVLCSEISFMASAHDEDNCPFIHPDKKLTNEHLSHCCYTQPKYRRIYGQVADIIVFDDNIFYGRGE